MIEIAFWFLIGFVAGFVLLHFNTIDDNNTDFVIFESQEELQEICWSGLRNHKK
tara:strand:+ start:638 stop:799 length:162 start_codon:yes stop_codon:yes gene_type:complete